MTINKFNYEVYALDYLEGNLSPTLVAEMEHFLQTHPTIEAELSGMMELVILEPDSSIVFEGKDELLKEETKVTFLHSRWIRPLIAAASLALLISTYFMGYQAGTNQTPLVVVKEGNEQLHENHNIKEHQDENLMSIPAENTLTKIEDKKKVEREIAAKASNLHSKTNDRVVKSTINKPTSTGLTKETSEKLTETKTIFSINKLMTEVPALSTVGINNDSEPTSKIQEISKDATSKPITFLKIEHLAIAPIGSNNSTLPNLQKVLGDKLPIDEALLAHNLKKKRSFKDLLGRFPITNLKEALIPSYYREVEDAGQ